MAGPVNPSQQASRTVRRQQAMMRMLAVDAQTLEVMSALASVGVAALLLKGPTIARLLYADDELRPYCDTDVLVSPATLTTAEQTLRELGYECVFGRRAMAMVSAHGYPWRRAAGGPAVDLHHTLPGVLGAPGDLWLALRPHIVAIELSGCRVQALDAPAVALHIALHATHHGPAASKPLRDLERALQRCTIAEWSVAAALAARVDATDAFGLGLRMLPAGCVLADELGLPPNESRRAALGAIGAPPVTGWVDRLLTTSGIRAKASLLVQKLLPPADFMRYSVPVARRGRAGLLLAYLWRPATVACRTPSAVRAWRQAGRNVVGRRSTGRR